MPFIRHTTRKGVQWVPMEKEVLTIGRSPDCDIPIEDVMSSRVHCELRKSAGGYILSDMTSKNGTFVNGEAVKRWVMKDGDYIAIGHHTLTFHLYKQ